MGYLFRPIYTRKGRKVKGETWQARVKAAGKWITKSTGVKVGSRATKKEAQKVLTRLEHEINEGTFEAPPPKRSTEEGRTRTLGNSLYLALSRFQGKAKWQRYKYCVDALLGSGSPLRELPYREITREKVEAYITYRECKGIRPGTILREVAFLKRVLRDVEDRGQINRRVYETIRDKITLRETEGLKGAHRRREIYLSPQEIKAVLQETQDPRDKRGRPLNASLYANLRDTFLVALYTGLRDGNLLRLRERHITIEDGRVVLRFSAEEMKGERDFTLECGPVASEVILRRHPMSGNPDRRMFPHDPRKAWETVRARLVAQGRMRRGITWHDLRHTFGTYRIAAGASLPQVAFEMHHRDQRTTMRYLHPITREEREYAQAAFAWDLHPQNGSENVHHPLVHHLGGTGR